MKEYIIRRLVLMIPTVLGVTILVFLLMHFIPGDPVTLMLGTNYHEATAAVIRQEYGLDRPLYIQYMRWLGRLFTGDWGHSIIANRAIFPDLALRLPVTPFLPCHRLQADRRAKQQTTAFSSNSSPQRLHYCPDMTAERSGRCMLTARRCACTEP